LLDGPSPFHALPRFSAALGGRTEVWIKREDLLPLAFGGNKLRNLEFLVGAAIAEGADCLVTSGRRWSNHARLTAAAGARAALPVHLVLSGPPVEPPGAGIVLAQVLGATIHQTASDAREEREATVDRVIADLQAAGRKPLRIGVGGSGVTGVLGQVLAAQELLDDLAAHQLAIDAIVLPTATGGTQAGLLTGLATAGSSIAVRGMAVAQASSELRTKIEGLLDDLATVAGLAHVPSHAVDLDDRGRGAGYGIPTRAAADAAALIARTEGILVDPIYTAKALAGLVELVATRELDGQTVAFWHAGGTPGLFEPLDQPLEPPDVPPVLDLPASPS
jgi:1-aminocyclopropane-1-carboxylate deaminase/D-cysteine desulfhydrase-like pyridoxal-dependent ACC family enzyme